MKEEAGVAGENTYSVLGTSYGGCEGMKRSNDGVISKPALQ